MLWEGGGDRVSAIWMCPGHKVTPEGDLGQRGAATTPG